MGEGVWVGAPLSVPETTGELGCMLGPRSRLGAPEPWQHRCRHTGAPESHLYDGAAPVTCPGLAPTESLNPHLPAQDHRSCGYRGGDQGLGKGRGVS